AQIHEKRAELVDLGHDPDGRALDADAGHGVAREPHANGDFAHEPYGERGFGGDPDHVGGDRYAGDRDAPLDRPGEDDPARRRRR
ncbi:MAG: hypothetical protein M3296_00360, partial [Actinomycetota bacterium]|nr:hypothetical protein [Actinomycetota bacterium]